MALCSDLSAEEVTSKEGEVQMVSLDEVAKSRRGRALIREEDLAHVTNGRSDLLPTSGYWLEVDGRTKKGWPELESAQREASALKQRYPRLRVAIYDAAEKKRTESIEDDPLSKPPAPPATWKCVHEPNNALLRSLQTGEIRGSNNMRSVILGAASALALASPAVAADLSITRYGGVADYHREVRTFEYWRAPSVVVEEAAPVLAETVVVRRPAIVEPPPVIVEEYPIYAGPPPYAYPGPVWRHGWGHRYLRW